MYFVRAFANLLGMTWRFAPLAVPLLPGMLVIAGLIALVVGQELATRRAVDGAATRARASAVLLASSFRRELEKFRLVSVVLAEDREAREALVTRDSGRLRALDRKLEALSDGTQAAAVYLLDRNGSAVAASNWRRADSFVGNNYAFRSYFRDAMYAGASQQFALGTRSRRPGLYVANRIDAGGRALGMFVVKIEFDALEAEWRASGNPAFATTSAASSWSRRTQAGGSRPPSRYRPRPVRASVGTWSSATRRWCPTGCSPPPAWRRRAPAMPMPGPMSRRWRPRRTTGASMCLARPQERSPKR
jgi:hypothetical protein